MDPMDLTRAIPLAWKDALCRLRSVCPSAVLAGGALRDLAWGGKVKDLDFFVPVQESDGVTLNHWTFPTRDWRGGVLVRTGYFAGFREEVAGVDQFFAPGIEEPIQVIHLNLRASPTPFAQAVADRMDFDACQIVYDGHEVFATADAFDAVQQRRMRLLRCEDDTQAARSLRRAHRFAERYPGMTIDVSLATMRQTPLSFELRAFSV